MNSNSNTSHNHQMMTSVTNIHTCIALLFPMHSICIHYPHGICSCSHIHTNNLNSFSKIQHKFIMHSSTWLPNSLVTGTGSKVGSPDLNLMSLVNDWVSEGHGPAPQFKPFYGCLQKKKKINHLI